MCLDQLTNFRVRKDPKTKQYVGWKIVRKIPSGFACIYFSRWRRYEEQMWYSCRSKSNLLATNYTPYPTGFHCYAKKRDAVIEKDAVKDWLFPDNLIVKKVFLNGILVTGVQEGKQCIVAQKMYIV
jgi:hypothetical protein